MRVLLFILVVLGAALRLEAATATWDRNPEATVTGYILSYGTSSGSHPTSTNVGNVTTYQFFPAAGQRYYVVVQAYNSSGGVSPKSAEVIVDILAANQAPTLTQPANQSSIQNTAVSLALVASDPDGNAITFGATGLPPGLSVSASTGVITGTVTTVGTYSVTATASDGLLTASRTFTWTVSASSGSITLTLSPADASISINSTNYSADYRLTTGTWPANRLSDAILMKFDISQLPANATVQSAVLQLALIKTDGVTSDPTYNVSLHQVINRNPDIARATGMTADGVIPWTANSCCAYNAPLAQADLSPARAVTGVNLTLDFKTWDATALIQAWRSAPATNFGLALDGDATKGADRYRQFASMENGTVANRPSLRITYTLSSGDTTPPTVALGSPANNATVSGSTVTVSATASDAVGVAGVQFRLDGAPLGSEDTSSPFSISWNSTTATNGTHTLTAVARDAAGNTATSAASTVNVSNTVANRAPTLTQPANQTTAEGVATSLTLVASDPDGNPLVFTATGLPGGLSITASTGVIAGTPSFTSAGSYTVAATVSDGSLTATRTFTWSVSNSDAPVQGDFDGDGRDDPATYRASTGEWRVWPSASNFVATTPVVWGAGRDVPIPADYDGDRKTDFAVYRLATGTWHVLLSSTSMQTSLDLQWGNANDRPVPIDYDGDGRADLALPRFGGFEILLSSSNYLTSVTVR